MKSLSFVKPLAVAVHEGRKTMTRRDMRVQPSEHWHPSYYTELHKMIAGEFVMKNDEPVVIGWGACNEDGDEGYVSPYKPGDICYVKEDYYQYGHWEPVEDVLTKGGKQKCQFVPDSEEILFDPPILYRKARCRHDPWKMRRWFKRLGRFMPEKYSRTLVEITNVRAERLQDISEQDAIAEGLISVRGPFNTRMWEYSDSTGGQFADPRVAFHMLWESINGPGSWHLNRWNWVNSFKRL